MEINEEVVSLAFKFMDKTYLTGKLVDTKHQTNTEFLSILDIIFDDLEAALKKIVNNFKHNVVTFRLGVEYLAFYKSKKSFNDEAGIRYFAKIKDVSQYKRGECTEIPAKKNTENQLYLRFNLDNIEEINCIEPIQSGTQLVSYTTLYLLKNAENMHELKMKSNLEIETYKRLNSLAKSNNWSIRKEYNQYLINGNTVEIIEDKKIRVNGRIVELRNIEREILSNK